MANIVELREMSDDKLEEMLENAREEMFNLRFRQASAQLEDYSRIRHVRREIAQLETVLNNRQQAIETAVSDSELAAVLAGKEWGATAFFSYEDSAWQVEFIDEDGNELATAMVNLNKKRQTKRQARQIEPSKRVTSYEIVE
jgi:large subunit ribosomal protein L29